MSAQLMDKFLILESLIDVIVDSNIVDDIVTAHVYYLQLVSIPGSKISRNEDVMAFVVDASSRTYDES